MAEFALLIDNVFKEIRQFPAKPADIPHKLATWHAVIREYGSPPFTGLVNGDWVIRKIDPATLPPPVPAGISSRQFRLQLRIMGRLAAVKNYIQNADEPTQIYFEYETFMRRNAPEILALQYNFSLTNQQMDDLFVAADQL